MVETGFLRTGHRVTADKAVCHSQLLHLLMDDSLYTSHICDNAAWLADLFQICKALQVDLYRST